jgi:two-component system, NtrC family, sensor histidine kinase KinB
MTLRHRILLILVPLLALTAVLGGVGVVLLYRLGGRIDEILRENYESVLAMERLNEALERIDSSFQIALAGRGEKDIGRYEERAFEQFTRSWTLYTEALQKEEDNVTIHWEEDRLVDLLEKATHEYRKQGNAFFQLKPTDPTRQRAYFGSGGLESTFKEIKEVSRAILELNQQNMRQASQDARQTANNSLAWFAISLGVATLLAGLWTAYTVRGVLRPIQAVTQAAMGISAGNLDQVVPYLSRDELGKLADSFNLMARNLRAFRRSSSDRLLRTQRTSQATIDSFPDPVVVVDSEGRVEMANPAAYHLLGVTSPGEGVKIVWIAPEPLRGPLSEALRGHGNYLPEEFDHAIVLHADGRERSFLPRILSIRDPYDQPLGAAVLLQDVTRFRFIDRLKSDLVATVSHELKTPLTSLRMDLHLVLEEAVGPLTDKQSELLLDARDNAERLLAIVNNLLDLARLEEKPDRLDLQPQSPADLVRAALDLIRPRAQDKELELDSDIPDDLPPVGVDPERMVRALHNLLENAVTYTDRGGQIHVVAELAGDRVVLSVRDTGVGIPAEYLPHVFKRFFRVPGQSRGEGTGLGLAIVREIVTAHDGEVSCTSEPGVGTEFRIRLPVWAPVEATAETAKEEVGHVQ